MVIFVCATSGGCTNTNITWGNESQFAAEMLLPRPLELVASSPGRTYTYYLPCQDPTRHLRVALGLPVLKPLDVPYF